MAMEKLKSTSIICRGGLNTNQNWIELNATNQGGSASSLVNFEPSLYGGYRRINGFTVLEDTDSGEVDPTGAEGRILGLAFHDTNIYAMRKQQSGNTYEFYQYVSGASWSKLNTRLNLNSIGVIKIRSDTFNFDGNPSIIFVDNSNNATLYNNTNWINIDPAATGANFDNAGGPQALEKPSLVRVWNNHVFMAGDASYPHIVAHSAPYAEYDWNSGSGAGQINVGMDVKQIFPFRDKLIVFGEEQIKYIYVNGSDFAVKDVTKNLGLYATDGVIEAAGDVIFLAPDGFRPFSATERIGDFELASISKAIQADILSYLNNYNDTEFDLVSYRSKSQLRLFISSTATEEVESPGIIGGLRQAGDGVAWEFGLLRGIKVSCAVSGFSGNPLSEWILHGTYDGKVMRQEIGNSFNGEDIYAEYGTPYLDFQEPSIRKTPHNITVFCRPEGSVTLNTALVYDWGIVNRINPTSYETETTGDPAIYGLAVYGTDTYGGVTVPSMITNVQGSGHSFKIIFSTWGQSAPYSIQSLVIIFEDNGVK